MNVNVETINIESIKEELIKEYRNRGMKEKEAIRKALLDTKRLEITNATPIRLAFLSKSDWLEVNNSEVLPMLFLDVNNRTIRTIWNRSTSSKLESLEPLTIIELIARGNKSLAFDDVSSSSMKVVGKLEPKELRNTTNYYKLKDIIGKDTGNDRVVTEGDILFSPKETSNGNLYFKLTDIYDEPSDIAVVFASPSKVLDEISRNDRILIIGNIRYNAERLVGSTTINADLVLKIDIEGEE